MVLAVTTCFIFFFAGEKQNRRVKKKSGERVANLSQEGFIFQRQPGMLEFSAYPDQTVDYELRQKMFNKVGLFHFQDTSLF